MVKQIPENFPAPMSTSESCHSMKNIDQESGIVNRGEWDYKEGGKQFNAFGFMPYTG